MIQIFFRPADPDSPPLVLIQLLRGFSLHDVVGHLLACFGLVFLELVACFYRENWQHWLQIKPHASKLRSSSSMELIFQIFQLFGQIAPNEKNKLGFLIDMIHIVGRPRDDGSPRPVIIQFTMRTFRQKIWKTSMTAAVMREKKLRLAEKTLATG